MKYKIGEFSKLVNVPIKTLRYYDELTCSSQKRLIFLAIIDII